MISFIIQVFPLYLVLLSTAELAWAEPQLISLRHPESNEHLGSRFGPVSAPGGPQPTQQRVSVTRSKFVAKPGNVIVHFDKQHEIQQLKYVLQDGKLVTLFERHPSHPDNVQTPIHVQVPEQVNQQQQDQEQVNGNAQAVRPPPSQQRQLTGPTPGIVLSGLPQNPDSYRVIDHDQTIDILNGKLQGVSQLVGDHVTIAIPGDFNSKVGSSSANASHPNISGAIEKLGILATVAKDAVQAGTRLSDSDFRQAGALLRVMKKKVGSKLRDLPSIIRNNLRNKSSAGQAFVDHASRKVEIVNNGSQNETSISTLQQQNLWPLQQQIIPKQQQTLQQQQLPPQQAIVNHYQSQVQQQVQQQQPPPQPQPQPQQQNQQMRSLQGFAPAHNN